MKAILVLPFHKIGIDSAPAEGWSPRVAGISLSSEEV
jgi:hypothetical protein